MIWSIRDGERVEATPGARGTCPQCQAQTIAKCGEINIWHWAHRVNECDPWQEPESAWHRTWKGYFLPEQQEVTVGDHRADVQTSVGVIEFQASPISAGEIQAREAHYQDMLWVLRGTDFIENLEFFHSKREYSTFLWGHPRKSWWVATKQILIDFGKDMFLIKKVSPHIPCIGWGYLMAKCEVLKQLGARPESVKLWGGNPARKAKPLPEINTLITQARNRRLAMGISLPKGGDDARFFDDLA